MKTISERFAAYTRTRFVHMPNKTLAAEIIGCAERDGKNAFAALKSFRFDSGLGIFGESRHSDAVVSLVERKFNTGKVPMYDYKPGKGRPLGSKNVNIRVTL